MPRRRSIFGSLTNSVPPPQLSGKDAAPFVSPDTLKRESAIQTLVESAPFVSPESAAREAAMEALLEARMKGTVDGAEVAVSPEEESEVAPIASPNLTSAISSWSAGLLRAVKAASGSPTPHKPSAPTPATVAYVDPVLCSDGVMRYAAQLRPLHVHCWCPRRYSEWLALETTLRSDGIEVSVPFPPKHVWFSPCAVGPGGRHDPSVVRDRTNAFQAWAEELIALPGAMELPAIRAFFAMVLQ